MTERERLIELIDRVSEDIGIAECETKLLADYLLSNGVIVPPCKVGEMIWVVDRADVKHPIKARTVRAIEVNKIENIVIATDEYGRRNGYMFCGFGKTVFLTKEEAEKALRERSEGK